MSFIVKNLCADEFRFTMGEGMMTLGDLRKGVYRRTGVLKCFLRFICSGRSYLEEEPDSITLEQMLSGHRFGGDPCDQLVWWLWMSDDNYVSKGRGGFFLESELPRKQAWHQEVCGSPLVYVTFREYRVDPQVIRLARKRYAKRNRTRTGYETATSRFEMGLRALSSDDEALSADDE